MIAHQDIEALIDGELDVKQAKIIANKIKKDAKLEHHYETLKKQKNLLQEWWQRQT